MVSLRGQQAEGPRRANGKSAVSPKHNRGVGAARVEDRNAPDFAHAKSRGQPPPLDSPAPETAARLRTELYAAFEAANVWLQFRKKLADKFLDGDAAGGLRETLGWICHSARTEPQRLMGALVYIALRDGLPCPPEYLPPPELPFASALAWALHGGAADEPAADPEGAADEAPPEPAFGRDAAQNALWQAACARLTLEVRPALLAPWLRGTRLRAGPEGECQVVAPTPQARDWLANRLAHRLERILAELSGGPVRVAFE